MAESSGVVMLVWMGIGKIMGNSGKMGDLYMVFLSAVTFLHLYNTYDIPARRRPTMTLSSVSM